MPVKGKHLLHYVPHGINKEVFKSLPSDDKHFLKLKKSYFDDKEYSFVVGFNSRNSHRKHPSNLILAFKIFCDHLSKEEAEKCALILKTDKISDAGTDLIVVSKSICPDYKVVLDDTRRSPEEMCAFYNICDVVANISSNEGFGLSVAESIMCEIPVITTVTGGLQDQVGFTDDDGNVYEFDLKYGTNSTGRYKKHGCWAKPLFPRIQTMQGSPPTPYIMDDFVDYTDVSDAIMYWYLMGSEKRKEFGKEGRRWACNEGGINSKNMCDQFIKAMDFTIDNYEPPKKFDVFKYTDYHDLTLLPQNEMGFETHKIDIEAIKKELP